jgi:hypothetical protein
MTRHSPEKQSVLDAMEHLLAKYHDMLPLFLSPARPMNVEWKGNPYFGVLPRVLRAPAQNDQVTGAEWVRNRQRAKVGKMKERNRGNKYKSMSEREKTYEVAGGGGIIGRSHHEI